jgi:hypothetical protein
MCNSINLHEQIVQLLFLTNRTALQDSASLIDTAEEKKQDYDPKRPSCISLIRY